MEKYSQYKDFYDQSVTLPIQGLRGTKLDLKMIGTAVGFFLVTAVLVSLIFPGDQKVFGVDKIWIILSLTGALIYIASKIDTANQPFFIFIFSVVAFLGNRAKNKACVGFKQVELPRRKVKCNWLVNFRDIIDNGQEVIYRMNPLKGLAKDIKGFSFWVQGATLMRYNPITKSLSLTTGKFEKLQPQEKSVGSILPLNMELGKGQVKFLVKKGQVHAIYDPSITPIIKESEVMLIDES